MSSRALRSDRRSPQPAAGEQAASRWNVLLVVLALFALVAGALWLSRGARQHRPEESGSRTLSESTRNVLKQLTAPVELRFYSILDPATVSADMVDFASRAGQLLTEYERESDGKLQVTRFSSASNAALASASSDGLKPFNLEKGSACYLGVAVILGARRETISPLSPEWEPALEFDLSRALARLIAPQPPAPVSAETATLLAAAADQVRSAIPDASAVSLDEGAQLLRQAALEDFKAAAAAMQDRVMEAQQRVLEAQPKSAEEQEAARKHLRQVQGEQSEKLKEIAARLQNQIEAWKQLKGGVPESSPAR